MRCVGRTRLIVSHHVCAFISSEVEIEMEMIRDRPIFYNLLISYQNSKNQFEHPISIGEKMRGVSIVKIK
jgi:hypothetical protein